MCSGAPGPPVGPERGRRDFEMGVPFAGREQPRERWTHTRLADAGEGPVDWEALFGRRAPAVVDLGCGNGRFLIASALSRPNRDHLGIDEVQRVVDFAVMRANRRALANVRFAVGDAAAFLAGRLAPATVDEIHVYHPQPYYRPEEAALRLVRPVFFLGCWRALRPAGVLILQTDNPYYWDYMLGTAGALFEPEPLPGPWPDAPRGRTRREILARARGLPVWRMIARRRDGLSPAEAEAAARHLPEPTFDANRPRFRGLQG